MDDSRKRVSREKLEPYFRLNRDANAAPPVMETAGAGGMPAAGGAPAVTGSAGIGGDSAGTGGAPAAAGTAGMAGG